MVEIKRYCDRCGRFVDRTPTPVYLAYMNKVLLNPNTEIHVNGYPILRDLCPKCTQRLIKALYRPEELKREDVDK